MLGIRCLLTSLLLLFNSSAFADFWADGRLGAGNTGLMTGIQFNYATESRIYTLGFNDIGSCSIFCISEKYDNYSEAYILLGRRKFGKWYTRTMQTGVSVFSELTYRDNFSDPQNTSKTGIGIPLDIGFVFGKYAGLNVNLHFNVNSIKPLASIMVGYSLGKFN